MKPKIKKHGGAGRGQGRKPGSSGPLSKRLNIKITADDLDHYDQAAKATGKSRSEWVRETLKRSY